MRETMKYLIKGITWVLFGLIATGGMAQAASDNLVIFDWAGYEDPGFFGEYMEKHGKAPDYSFFADEEEAFQKIRTGFRADLAHPCSQSAVKWRKAGIIEPIDTSRLKNWSKVMSQFRNIEGFHHGGKQWIIPIDWGATAITYRTDKVSEAEASTLLSFINPKFKDRISIPDNLDDAYALAFLANGIKDWNTASMKDLEDASNFLRKVHKNVRTYWSDPAELRQLMASGEILISWAWNEVAVVLASEKHPVEMKIDTKEGASTWVCGYVKLANAPGSEQKAYDFIDAFLSDSAATYLLTEWGYGHTNETVMNSIGAENGFADLESYTKNTLMQSPLDPKIREKMIKDFEKIKAGY